MLSVSQRSCEYRLSSHGFDPTRNKTQVYSSRGRCSYHSVIFDGVRNQLPVLLGLRIVECSHRFLEKLRYILIGTTNHVLQDVLARCILSIFVADRKYRGTATQYWFQKIPTQYSLLGTFVMFVLHIVRRKCRGHSHLDASKLHLFRYFKTRTIVHDRVFNADYKYDIIF